MVEGDLVAPSAHGGVAAEGIAAAEGLKENVVGDVLGEGGLASEAEGEVVDGGGVRVVDDAEGGLPGPGEGDIGGRARGNGGREMTSET